MLNRVQLESELSVILEFNRICTIGTSNKNTLSARKILSNYSFHVLFFCVILNMCDASVGDASVRRNMCEFKLASFWQFAGHVSN